MAVRRERKGRGPEGEPADIIDLQEWGTIVKPKRGEAVTLELFAGLEVAPWNGAKES